METPANAFYDRLNQILDEHKFDAKVERLCHKFYKKSPYGRPSVAPGRLLSVSSDRLLRRLGFGTRNRLADGRLAVVTEVLGLRAGRLTPDHSTISRMAPLVLAGDTHGDFPLGAEDPR